MLSSHPVFPLGWSHDGGVDVGKGWRSKDGGWGQYLLGGGGGGEGEAASLVELHVSDATHGLHLRLVGAEIVVVFVVSALKQVLVAPVSGVLVTHPTGRGDGEGGGLVKGQTVSCLDTLV